ncbi:hypothetical protein [Paractinoplanes durhamensis]|uniref:hypothetical protein n=1 Tax=Paractinoplanes durhamensis TaxID=113563 RepID=UPI0036417D53
MNRLQAVPDVGQRSAHDHAHRVVEVRPLHLDFEADGLDSLGHATAGLLGRFVAGGRFGSVSHC